MCRYRRTVRYIVSSDNQADTTQTGTTAMPTTGMNPAPSETDVADRAGLRCAVCPHPLDAHDRIGLRYCTATAASSVSRGCVCVGDTVKQESR